MKFIKIQTSTEEFVQFCQFIPVYLRGLGSPVQLSWVIQIPFWWKILWMLVYITTMFIFTFIQKQCSRYLILSYSYLNFYEIDMEIHILQAPSGIRVYRKSINRRKWVEFKHNLTRYRLEFMQKRKNIRRFSKW